MKKTLCLLIPMIAALLSLNVDAASCGKTRAEVRAELAALEAAGFNPAANDLDYPNDIRAAQRRLAAHAVPGPAAVGTLRFDGY
jgi:hypothetical protein